MAHALHISAAEAADPNGGYRRAQAGRAAGAEVHKDVDALDRDVTRTTLDRLARLKRELQGIIAAGGTNFRRFTARTLIIEVDRLIADATRDLQTGTRGALLRAQALGNAAVENPIKAGRIAVSAKPGLDDALVNSAFDLTGDLLTPAMQTFRSQVVQQIRRATTIGTDNSLTTLARNIDAAGFDAAKFKAERIIRTETSRVLNTATYTRMVELAKTMPFLRKGWRATKDTRTRLGHVEAGQTYARGVGSIPIATPFSVNVYQESTRSVSGAFNPPKLLGSALLRFPVDPDATPTGRLAAGATIMCRCNAFTDFNVADLNAYATSRSQAVSVPPTLPTGQRLDPNFTTPPRRTAPLTVVPKATAVDVAKPLARKEPVRSSIPGGNALLAEYEVKLARALEEAHRDLFEASGFNQDPELRRLPFREALQTINADGTRGRMFTGGESYVTLTDEVVDEISKSTAFIHTHPASSAFSLADVLALARFNKPGFKMLVYGRSGSWFEMSAPSTFTLSTPAGREIVKALNVAESEQNYRALNRAKYRIRQQIPQIAKDRGVSVLDIEAAARGDEELQDLFQLYVQEESVEQWETLANTFGLKFRYYLPPAPTVNSKHRSREAVVEAARRRGADVLDDWLVSRAANVYDGEKETAAQTQIRAELKALGIELDATTGERRATPPTPGK